MDDPRKGLDEISQKWIDMLGFEEEYKDKEEDGFETKDLIEFIEEEKNENKR